MNAQQAGEHAPTTGENKVVIVGAGLVGSLLACSLGRRGYQVDVYERRPDPRVASAERGRSINLALSERGLDALRRFDLADEVMAPALPMHGRLMHGRDGSLTFQSYSADGRRAINSISRGSLNATLLDAAERTAGVRVRFDARLAGIDLQASQASFEIDGRPETVRYHALLGADGGGSAVRKALVDAGITTVTEDIQQTGYKELTIPAVDGEFALDPDALHIWPRGGSMMIALPNPDRTFTCTLFWPKDELAALATPEQIIDHFQAEYPDAVPLMPTLVDDYQHNPIGMLGTIHAEPWHAMGNVGLIGDAAHAILPFFGQGANCGFEDIVELDRCLDEAGDDWARALPMYQERRRVNAEAIAWLAKENFVEMRDKVGSRAFLVTKQLEHALERVLPGTYLSRYEMVSFTTIPYAEVIERDARQRRMVLAGVAAIGLTALTLAVGAARRVGRRS
ncbi:MAG: FAD-dependent monooxygenase [Actinomycetales bacterium]|nr:FAD-dependent monooxygenase [Actinomycetales bacterium]